MELDIAGAIRLLFASDAGAIATTAGIAYVTTWGVRQLVAPLTRKGPPWSRIGRWLSGSTGGFLLSAAMTGSAALLQAASAGPLDRPGWGAFLLAWLTAMGLNSAAKRAPGLAHLEDRRKRVAGSAVLGLALALGLSLPSTALAEEGAWVNWRAPGAVVNQRPVLADYLTLGPSAGVEMRGGQVTPAVQLLGGVHLVTLRAYGVGAPLKLTALLGGSMVLGDEPAAAFVGGLGVGPPTDAKVKTTFWVGAAYHGPGWGVQAGVAFGLL